MYFESSLTLVSDIIAIDAHSSLSFEFSCLKLHNEEHPRHDFTISLFISHFLHGAR